MDFTEATGAAPESILRIDMARMGAPIVGQIISGDAIRVAGFIPVFAVLAAAHDWQSRASVT